MVTQVPSLAPVSGTRSGKMFRRFGKMSVVAKHAKLF